MRRFDVIGLIMSHQIVIKIGTIGGLYTDNNLLIVIKIEGDYLYCHRFRGNLKTIKVLIKDFEPLIY